MENLSFIFGGDTGVESPQELAKKRDLVRALQTRSVSATPRSFGQGLTAIGQALAGRISDRDIGKREEAERERVSGAFGDITSQLMGGGYGSTVSTRTAPQFAPQSASAPPVTTQSLDPVAQQVGADAMAAIGKPANTGLPESIVRSESGGNWNALNSEGYGGRGQFGKARLADAARAGVIPAGMTGEDYSRAPEEVQLAVESWHKNDILGNLGQFVGVDVDGPGPIPPLTENSLLAVAHLGGTNGAKRFVETGGKYNPADSNGTSLSDYAMMHAGGPSNGGGGGGGGRSQRVDPQLIAQLSELASNPYLPEGQRAIVQQLMGNQMSQMDPMRQMEMERTQLELEQLRSGTGAKPSGVQELEWRAQQAGLQPGTPEYQSFILNGGGDPATFRALQMQAVDAGLQPGTPEYQEFMATRGAGQQSFARVTGENMADVETGGAAAAAVARGSEEGKAAAVSGSELAEMQRNMPGLLAVAEQLDELAGKATYTLGGRAVDELNKQLGGDPTDAAIARAEYIAVVDNQVLPLLRQTFGAAFTAKEGDTLRATLGDPNKSPAEKRAVLNAFIEQKKRDLEARGGVVPENQTGADGAPVQSSGAPESTYQTPPELSADDLKWLEGN